MRQTWSFILCNPNMIVNDTRLVTSRFHETFKSNNVSSEYEDQKCNEIFHMIVMNDTKYTHFMNGIMNDNCEKTSFINSFYVRI